MLDDNAWLKGITQGDASIGRTGQAQTAIMFIVNTLYYSEITYAPICGLCRVFFFF